MTAQDDDATLLAARKLFAGPCEFVWGTGSIDSLPPQGLPEVAFVGRSNAGKSSLVNALTGRKTLARVSQTPGRTREINFFKLGDRLMLVDLPGYGYAKASKSLAAEWQRLIFAYLRGRANLRRVVLLMDGRRGVMDLDNSVMDLLDAAAVSYCVSLTKIDKVPPPERPELLADVMAQARKHTAAYPEVFATSALKAEGLDPLKVQLAALAEPHA
ncbi:MAG: YihA family ribosome biogenesis GTP-binding protein [Alphaproteobacteria bacterium]|nr:YihA family ribosome biogenesis GTP-binding protein [Alphaproteobacteria bacterium]MDE2162645.1 YihA family ribosome biogenesis GTP-binding protein [Alphaproteobacteria bacterium]MDE2266982.1 YihA family ribosome biogenesis GTP-binding protein [Alphaproteobacteria bacterium]MDE2499561.1 YihA family ribosome biogenesis GTP-binding protein [Alphaproteobacteria bacterium]